ncbi:fibroblast growth factor-binding protein 1 [Kryptolebias marmoratus]|uniref:Fibroblast growth factor binding protein 1b n=1 Tax=Kryptolebias marmoratus TaxID=37003 RepID=A0A3Q3A6Z0_KRYMA|nr:fibroblast growth factor-binding protein 1 [Kryptolebias marmoratus]
MFLLRTLALCLLVAPLQQQRLSAAGRAPGPAGGPVSGRGRFSTSDRMQCTWTARDAGDSVNLRVRCQNPEARVAGGITDMSCEYRGRPRSCPAFGSDPRGFWKQVGRALRKLRARLCRDERAPVRAGMCRRAPGDVNFLLDVDSLEFSAQSGEPQTPSPAPAPAALPTSCTGPADQRRTAEEHCSGAWASVCSFFMSMLQTDAC